MINATISSLRGRSLAFLVASAITGGVFVGAVSTPVAAEAQSYPPCSATVTDECVQAQPGETAMHHPAARHAMKHRMARHHAKATRTEEKAR